MRAASSSPTRSSPRPSPSVSSRRWSPAAAASKRRRSPRRKRRSPPAALLAIELIYRRLRGRAGLGLGDVKLAGVAGAWLSASLLPAAIELAALAALLAYAARQIRKRRQFRSGSRLPFAAFLAPSIWIVWLFETSAHSF